MERDMSRPFRALLWKEWMEVRLVALPLPFVYAGLFYLTRDMNPSGGELARTILSGPTALLMVLAFLMGFGQTRLEASDDMWAFALHRPARWEVIFGAKLLVGVVVLVVPMLVAGVAATVWQMAAGNGQGLYWIPTVASCAAALTYHAAGLYAGSPRRGFVHGAAAFAVAAVGLIVATFAPVFPLAVVVTLGLTPFVAAAARTVFMTPE
jgi:hypothetical protein